MALRLLSVTRRFGSATALGDVSLHVRPGDCYGFLGHNGAGKTTSMRVALGLERADAGRVIVDGFDAAEFPREARARMGGLIETPGFHGHLGGVANLVLLARLQGLGGTAARREAERLVESVGLAAAGTKAVRNYSQGMRQRLGIAQALIGSPKVVLLDEPMNGLDPEGIEEIRRLLARLTRDEGMTVLLSSHQLSEIAGLCNRIGILRAGRMLVEEETSKLLAAEAGRYALATADDAAAARILAAAGMEARPHAAGGLELSLGDRLAEDVAADLVARGVRLRTWAPRPPSLEEIYLRFTQSGEARNERIEVGETAPPSERRAPPLPVLRVAAYEFRRWTSTSAVPVLLALPMLVAVHSVWSRYGTETENAAKVAGGTLASTSTVTAFEAFGCALQTSLPLVALTIAGLASQSLAGELSRGTLRNVLLRPVRRVDAAAGKFAALVVAALVAYALTAGAAFGASAHWFEFKDMAEILPNGRPFVMAGGEAAKMWPALTQTLLVMLPAVAAFAGVGLAAGAVVRSGAAGLALAAGGAALLVVLGIVGAAPLDAFVETTRVMSTARDPQTALHVLLPLASVAVSFALAAAALGRRSIR